MEARIFIVEDHLIFREGLVSIINDEIDLVVCGEADDVAGALDGRWGGLQRERFCISWFEASCQEEGGSKSTHVMSVPPYYGMRSSPVETLTDREIQVFQLVGEGKSVADIAHILSRSPKTIHNHIDHIKEKLHVGSRQELYQRAREWVLHPDKI